MEQAWSPPGKHSLLDKSQTDFSFQSCGQGQKSSTRLFYNHLERETYHVQKIQCLCWVTQNTSLRPELSSYMRVRSMRLLNYMEHYLQSPKQSFRLCSKCLPKASLRKAGTWSYSSGISFSTEKTEINWSEAKVHITTRPMFYRKCLTKHSILLLIQYPKNNHRICHPKALCWLVQTTQWPLTIPKFSS